MIYPNLLTALTTPYQLPKPDFLVLYPWAASTLSQNHRPKESVLVITLLGINFFAGIVLGLGNDASQWEGKISL